MSQEVAFQERFTACSAKQPGRKHGAPQYTAEKESKGKRVYVKPQTGFVTAGGGQNGKPPAESPPAKAHIKLSEKSVTPISGLVVGSPQRLAASIEKEKDINGHVKGKKQPSAEISPKFVSTLNATEEEKSARRKAKIAKERQEFPCKPAQQVKWEKGNLNPTAAINMHLNHGIGVQSLVHGSTERITASEIERTKGSGAAGKVESAPPARDHSSKHHSGVSRANLDHICPALLGSRDDNNSSPSALSVASAASSTASPASARGDEVKQGGKRTKIRQAQKSPQRQHREEGLFGAAKKRPQFGAQRTGSARVGSSGRNKGSNAPPKRNQTETRELLGLSVLDPNVTKNDSSASSSSAPPTASAAGTKPVLRLQKKFHTHQKSTSADNLFASANHSNCASASTSTTNLDGAGGSTGNIPANSSTSFGSAAGSSGKKFLHAQKANSSLKGVLNPESPRSGPTKKISATFAKTNPFGTHENQDVKKAASPARIGFH